MTNKEYRTLTGSKNEPEILERAKTRFKYLMQYDGIPEIIVINGKKFFGCKISESFPDDWVFEDYDVIQEDRCNMISLKELLSESRVFKKI